jgi:hypothetical protein
MTVAFPLLPPEAWLFHCSLITSHSALPPNILSVQSSKGLEFRSVIFIGFPTSRIDHARRMQAFCKP